MVNESVAKVLDATGATLEAFTALVSGARAIASIAMAPASSARRVPLIGFAQAGADGYFDDGGFPLGGGWDEVSLPEIGDAHAYALEISGNSMEPVFRDAVVIALPFQPLCRPDCEGLCADCGIRLEDAPEGHAHERVDPRWAALAHLAGTSETSITETEER